MRSLFVRGPRSRHPRGFTLVELLIAMTLTLMLVYAIAQFYAYVGETVRDGRAQIEMGGQLRAAAARLRLDFDEMTVRIGGKVETGSQEGFMEIVEGGASDSDPQGDAQVDLINNTFVSTDLADVNFDGKPDGAMLGDLDDVLSMTIRSSGEPYVGRWWGQFPGSNPPSYGYQIVRSNLAEVVWFTSFKDVNGDGDWDINSEPRYLVRRQLLIIPDLQMTWPNAPNALPNGESIYHHSDVSCHVVLNNMGQFAGYAANSLGDLSRRENRCVHQNLFNLNANTLLAPNYMPNSLQLNVGLTNVPATPLFQQGAVSLYSLDGFPRFQGEDKILSNLLAFDVRVYDPFASLIADNADLDGTLTSNNPDDNALGVLSPGDPGYAWAALNYPVTGYGAYVDLWYTRAFANIPVAQRIPIMLRCNSAYAWAPAWKSASGGATWDTWTSAYEKDGLGQFGLPVDQMVNGLDDNGFAGVDDPTEADTRPPYPSLVGDNNIDEDGDGLVDGADNPNAMSPPNQFFETMAPPAVTTLRGVQVRIRMYEPGTRQSRQVTVASDHLPE